MTDKERNNDKQSDSKQHGSPAPKGPDHERLDKQEFNKPQVPDVNAPTVQPGHRDREQI